MLRILPLVLALPTSTPWLISPNTISAAYCADPVTFLRPSTRFTGAPINVVAIRLLSSVSVTPFQQFFQSKHQCPFGQLHLECVVLKRFCIGQCRFGRRYKRF